MVRILAVVVERSSGLDTHVTTLYILSYPFTEVTLSLPVAIWQEVVLVDASLLPITPLTVFMVASCMLHKTVHAAARPQMQPWSRTV